MNRVDRQKIVRRLINLYESEPGPGAVYGYQLIDVEVQQRPDGRHDIVGQKFERFRLDGQPMSAEDLGSHAVSGAASSPDFY
jgi:hypothetical protein